MSTDWRPTASPGMLRRRAALLARLRAFFQQRNVLEVETPLLAHAGVTAPALGNFRVQAEGATPACAGYLQTSPEYAMKRLLAAGSGDIFQIARAFRAGESGRRHNPEFTLLEWYRVGWELEQLMAEVAALLAEVLERELAPLYLTWAEAFARYLGVEDAHAADVATLREAGRREGVAPGAAMQACDDRDTWRDLLLSAVIEPRLPADRVVFLTDWPASQAALARIDDTGPHPVARRFEVFVGGMELANGYDELTDAAELARRFAADNRQRAARGLPAVPADGLLLAAMTAGLPACSGVALGVDRLLMLATGAARIEDVLAFPFARA